MVKSLQDINNQIESKHIELKTFEKIREREHEAIHKRLESLGSEVSAQNDREKQLQSKFRQLMLEKDELLKCN